MTSVLFGSLARANATTFGKAPSAQFASIQPSVDTCTFGAIRAKHLKDKEAVVAALELLDSLEGRDNPTQEKLEKKQSLADSIVNFLVRDNGNTLPVTITPFPNSPEYKTLTIDGTPYEINMTYGSQNVDRNRRYHVPGITIENSSHSIGHQSIYSSDEQIVGDYKVNRSTRGPLTTRAKQTAETVEKLVGAGYPKTKYKDI